MPTEELPGTNNPAEAQGRIESGNKNNPDQENTGETKETIESAKGLEEMVKLADKDISLTLKKAKEGIKEGFGTITDHGGATPEDTTAAKEAGDYILARNEQDAQIAKKEIGDSDTRLSSDEAEKEADAIKYKAIGLKAKEGGKDFSGYMKEREKIDEGVGEQPSKKQYGDSELMEEKERREQRNHENKLKEATEFAVNPLGKAKERALQNMEEGDLARVMDNLIRDINEDGRFSRFQRDMVINRIVEIKNDSSLTKEKAAEFIKKLSA